MTTGTYLADIEINALASEGQPLVLPFEVGDVRPASIDLRLSGERYEYGFDNYRLGDVIADEDSTRVPFDDLIVSPQETVHVGLDGEIRMPKNSLGWIVARSSLTRLGLRIAPVFMNPGYIGRPPITITNASSFKITLVKGVRVAQLVCARLAVTPTQTYEAAEGKYMHENTSPSRIHTDNEIKAAMTRVLQGYFSDSVVKTVV